MPLSVLESLVASVCISPQADFLSCSYVICHLFSPKDYETPFLFTLSLLSRLLALARNSPPTPSHQLTATGLPRSYAVLVHLLHISILSIVYSCFMSVTGMILILTFTKSKLQPALEYTHPFPPNQAFPSSLPFSFPNPHVHQSREGWFLYRIVPTF